jgi:hypothetical protein
MSNFKKRRHFGRQSCRMCRPWKLCGSPPDGRFSISELRRIGGRTRRIRRRDVSWAFRDEG